jgi:hypothetical protein
VRIDDVDAGVRTIGKVVFRPVRIGPADVEGTKRTSGNGDGGQAFRLGGGRGAPGPVQGAAKAGNATKDAAPMTATAMEPDKQANASLCFDMELPPSPPEKSR